MDRRFLIGGGAAVVAAAAGSGIWYMNRPAEAQTQVNAGAASPELDEIDTSSVVEMALGAEDAPVTMVEYASFTCPHCADFHERVFNRLKTDYIDTGKVRFIYRDVYFDRYGLWASMIARCAGPDKFFGLASMYYKSQDTWLRGAESEAQIADNLRKIGRLAGMDDATLEECLNDVDMARTLTAWYQKNAQADEINATPTLLIDGEKHSNMTYADLQEILDGKLEG
ncbi:Disulfide bond formation protein D precursor [Pseudooceanicola marinus]|uniref:Disulfide bond formation protein D n=1 Tax=Pseudooceanicola marinus TaxID=396013 RepID=A0A1X6ZTB5_9RHOB|nr:DsbA family protein [Pseudooceanicola marinus]MCA1335696.1 DsbA family protein [Pseudooceanicola marinus]PJE30617.1 thiol-disulfide oxidoreductase [Pseudooceanicola marinus]SLN61114.1 Disulfide bond formation protein D precursor [Pseudooceanicola marinus]